MACSDQCYANYCTGNRPSCAANRPVTLPNVAVGNVIKAADIELLRANTIAEIQTWKTNVNYSSFQITATEAIATGSTITSTETNKLISDLNSTLHGTTPQITAGTIVTASNLASNMLAIYNSLRTDCVCNSDCGPHSVCACHGDCGCNYSDKNLKTNIVYF